LNISSQRLVFLLADVTVRATLVLALAALFAILSRRASASFRHFVWALGLGCALCLPVLTLALPGWRVAVKTSAHFVPIVPISQPMKLSALPPENMSPIPAPSRPEMPIKTATATPMPPVLPSPTIPDTVPQSLPIPITPQPMRLPWTFWAMLIWAVGVFFTLARLALGLLKIRQVPRESLPVTTGNLSDVMTEARSLMQIARPIALRLSSSPGVVTVPITYGARRPVIVLPAGAELWPAERLQAALLHEMAHIRRGDWLLNLLAHLTCSLYWFHPLAWLALGKMRSESETSCDDLVLAAGVPAPDYARHLLDVALSARRRSPLDGAGTVAMAQGPKVEKRLRAILATGLSRRPVTRWTGMGVLAAALLLIVPVAALRLSASVAARGFIPQGPPVPAAARLQLQGDFTLRYAVTVTDQETTQAQFREYQQLRADYTALLRKDPYFQPVPVEYYAPFPYFQSRRPKTTHEIITLSAQDGKLLWRSEQGGDTYAELYNGRDGTQLFSNGEAGRIESGLTFYEMTDCPLPAVGLPHVPLLEKTTLLSASGDRQTWGGQFPLVGAEQQQGKVLYTDAVAEVVRDRGAWKIMDMNGTDQQLQFLQNQKFQGFWLASHMTLTKYTVDNNFPPRHISSVAEFIAFCAAHRTPTSVCEYHLISASSTPLDLSGVGMHLVSAAPHIPIGAASVQTQQLDDFSVQEALHLRYHLQGWAVSHQALLQQLAQGEPTARVSAMRVAASLQALPFPLWQGDPRPNHVWDGDPRIGHDGQKPRFTAEHLAALDPNIRDFKLASSRNSDAPPSTSRVTLWASGRITIETPFLGTHSGESQREIVPAFFGDDGRSNMAGDSATGIAGQAQLNTPPASAASIQRDTAPAHIAHGLLLQQNGQSRDGIPDFRQAVLLDTNNAQAQFWLANALYGVNNKRVGHTRNLHPAPPAMLDEAILHLRKAVALQPGNVDWLSALGT
jgi:beta-lactamase regulating signal transducer with metallopeptidase domain